MSRCGGIQPAFALSEGIDLPSELQSQLTSISASAFQLHSAQTDEAITLYSSPHRNVTNNMHIQIFC